MSNDYFFAQDLAGNAHKVLVNRHYPIHPNAAEPRVSPHTAPRYLLDDGSAVKRIDSDTFQITGTGAFITLVRE